ncbi:MAG: ABC transporter permease [Erysipelotrichaceae bacterium]
MFKTFQGLTTREILGKIVKDYSYWLSFFLLIMIAASLNANFFTWNNISNIFVQSTMIGLIAMGMSMVISAGQIDISVGSQVALLGGFGISVLNSTGSVWIMLLFCLVGGAIIGTVNGLLVAKGHLPAMIATLAMQTACRSIINFYGQGGPFTVDRSIYEGFREIAVGGLNIFGFTIPYMMIIFIAVTIVFNIIMKRTKFGKHIYAVGSNETSAKLAGISVDRTKILVFTFTGIMCGLAAVLYASRLTAVASANAAVGYEMEAIAAVAIGGTAMSGGKGKIMGTFLGVLMFKIISNILTSADVSSFLNGAISGAIIVIAVLIQNLQNRKK